MHILTVVAADIPGESHALTHCIRHREPCHRSNAHVPGIAGTRGPSGIANPKAQGRGSLLRWRHLLVARSLQHPRVREPARLSALLALTPNPALQPTDPPSARRRLRLQAALPSLRFTPLGAAELDR